MKKSQLRKTNSMKKSQLRKIIQEEISKALKKSVNENETTDYVKDLEKAYNGISKYIEDSSKLSGSYKLKLQAELNEDMWDVIGPGDGTPIPERFDWWSDEVYNEVDTIGPMGKNNIIPQLWGIVK